MFWIPHNLMGFDDLGLSGACQGLSYLIQDVLAHDVIIQLRFAFAVETEPPDFAFDFAFVCGVAIILGTARHEFHDVIILFQFTGKVAEVIAQDRVGLTLLGDIDHRVGVVVQDAFPQQLKGFIHLEPGPTGGEAGHKDVEIGGDGGVFLLVLVVDLYHVVIDDGDMTYIHGICVQESVKGLGIMKFVDLGFVEPLSKLAPHGIEHHLGQGTETRILVDLAVLQLDTFVLVVLPDVCLFLFLCVYPGGPSTGFLLDF